MNAKNHIYFHDLMTDLRRNRKKVFLFMAVSVMTFFLLGYQKAPYFPRTLSEEEQEEMEIHELVLEVCDKLIADAKEGIALAEGQISDQQEYVEQSIYMKLDPQNIQAASVVYRIVAAERIDEIYGALACYLREGGLAEDLAGKDGGPDTKYWREVTFCSLSGDSLCVTIYHYDASQVRDRMAMVKQCLLAQVPSVAADYGAFSLRETDSAYYVKSDQEVFYTQNDSLERLKASVMDCSDYTDKLASQEKTKQTYLKNNAPSGLLQKSVWESAGLWIRYMAVGLLFGMVLPCVYFLLSYIMGDRIRSCDGLKEYGLSAVGRYLSGETSRPELDRPVMLLRLLSEQNRWDAVFLSALDESGPLQEAVLAYQETLAQAGLPAFGSCHLEESAEELGHLVETKNCVLFLQIAKTTYAQLEAQINLCQKFDVTILGYVAVI